MAFALAVIAAAVIAGSVGYFFPRWWLVPVALLFGAIVIAVDVSTRDLQTAGHDDRLLVAVSEALFLVRGPGWGRVRG